jgi:carotenoid 1,2-hydratase
LAFVRKCHLVWTQVCVRVNCLYYKNFFGVPVSVIKSAPSLAEIGPRFDAPVGKDGGYAWWYVDALSDDGIHGLTMIAFIGSVFSPYYAWSNWADPLQHCAINVALYRLDGARGRWAMTERGAKDVSRTAVKFHVGPSSLRWEDGALIIEVDEVTIPLPSRLRGTIKVVPQVMTASQVILSQRGNHIWHPLAPRARVTLDFDAPDLSWSGDGYFDTNRGDEPLERAFVDWHWGRAHVGDGVRLFYDVARRDRSQSRLALNIDHNGVLIQIADPPTVALPNTFWHIDRKAWRDEGAPITVLKTLEDTPFYARSALTTQIDGKSTTMMHESLDLNRLKNPVIRAMLPFRMPRASF